MNDLDKRLAELENRNRPENDSPSGGSVGIGLKLAADFFAAVAVGALLGYWMDRWFSTRPLFLIIFLFLGFATGVYRLYKTSQELEEKE